MPDTTNEYRHQPAATALSQSWRTQRPYLYSGVIPAQLRDFIEMVNVSACIGSELLQHYALTLTLDEGVLMLDPLATQIH